MQIDACNKKLSDGFAVFHCCARLLMGGALLFFLSQAYGQDRRCASEHLLRMDQAQHPERISFANRFQEEVTLASKSSFRLEESDEHGLLLTIPVVVHVVHNDKSAKPSFAKSSNIPDEQIFSQLRVLNEDFRRMQGTNGYGNNPLGADIQIEFCLASVDPNGNPTRGINRIYHAKQMWGIEDEETMKALSYWPSDQYLNIWVCNMDVSQGLGYARYPYGSDLDGLNAFDYGAAVDGVVIHYKTFGTTGSATYPYNLGRTATHEVGHWLGLIHIWGDAVCGSDYVNDTPPDQSANKDNDCADSSFCSEEWTQDLTSNYLDFSPDRCMNLFTKGQKKRMLIALYSSPRRLALFQSKGCALPQGDELNVRLHPLPAFDQLIIEFFGPGHEWAKLEWYDSQGLFLKEEEIHCNYQESFYYPTSEMASGMYLLKITNNTGKKVAKVIIAH